MFLGPWACGSECCSSNSNAPDISQKGLIGIQSHHSREKMSKKAREKPAEAGSASVSPYGSVLGYELVTSQPNRLINPIWPECRTWLIGPCPVPVSMEESGPHKQSILRNKEVSLKNAPRKPRDVTRPTVMVKRLGFRGTLPVKYKIDFWNNPITASILV